MNIQTICISIAGIYLIVWTAGIVIDNYLDKKRDEHLKGGR